MEDAVFARCQVWIAEHYDEPNPVTAMVRLSGLADWTEARAARQGRRVCGFAERSLKRRFRPANINSQDERAQRSRASVSPPLEYVHALRIEEAKQMLEAGDEPIEAIAQEVGYEDAAFFSRCRAGCTNAGRYAHPCALAAFVRPCTARRPSDRHGWREVEQRRSSCRDGRERPV